MIPSIAFLIFDETPFLKWLLLRIHPQIQIDGHVFDDNKFTFNLDCIALKFYPF